MKYFIANFKQNLTGDQLHSWLESFRSSIPLPREAEPLYGADATVILAPAFPQLADPSLQSLRPGTKLSAQTVSPFASGAHTGQVGASQLTGLVDYCLVGHSETRQDLKVTDLDVAKQTKLLLSAGITPVICLDTPYLESQISILKRELLELPPTLIYAYEPVNAIGTGQPDTPAHANEIAFKIETLTSKSAPVLYGGSVTVDNAAEFLKQDFLSGFIVGKSSLDPQEFAKIIG